MDHQTNVWIGLEDDRSLFAQLRTERLKVHFDNGKRKLWGKDFNFYATMVSSNILKDMNWRFGLSHSS